MAAVDIAILVIAGTLLAALAMAVLTGRRRRRELLSLLYHETFGLCREAAGLAEEICTRQADGRSVDQAVLVRHALTEPRTYPGLVPSLWRLPGGLAWRAVEFHGHLCLARTRLDAWRSGERDAISTYLLISALLRSANGGDGILRDRARALGWRRQWWKPDMPVANAYIDRTEQAEPDLMDWGYWSLPS